jgi:voltage-gated potassium channel
MSPDELREMPLFAGMSEGGLALVAADAAELEVEPGQVLALPGDPGSGMFVICEGQVTVESRAGPISLGEGNFVGELALLVPDSGRVARVRAATPVRCLSISRDDFLALAETEPTFTLELLRELARRLYLYAR